MASLKQDDFRKLLLEGKAQPSTAPANSGESEAQKRKNEDESAASKKKKPRPLTKYMQRKQAEQEAEEDEANNQLMRGKYRDRAAERRKGINVDYDPNIEKMALDAEQSKFLGGDFEHTHLVKGLDYALLAKIKSDKEKAMAQLQKYKDQGSASVSPKAELATLESPTARVQEPLTFKSQLARRIWRQLSTAPASTGEQKNEWFLPGRLWFSFNLQADGPDMPLLTHYSKEDCPAVAERHTDLLPEALTSKLKDIMTLVRQGHHKPNRRRKKEQNESSISVETASNGRPPVPPPRPEDIFEDDEDDDIFPSATPSPAARKPNASLPARPIVTAKAAAWGSGASKGGKGYFSDLGLTTKKAREEEEEAAQETDKLAPMDWKRIASRAASEAGVQVKRSQVEQMIEREESQPFKPPKETDDYDQYFEYGGIPAYDSEEEDGPRPSTGLGQAGSSQEKSKGGGKKKGKKAAAELSQKERAKKKEQKLDASLNKITQILKDKYHHTAL